MYPRPQALGASALELGAGAGAVTGIGAPIGAAVGGIIGGIFPGGHYTGPVFIPNGVVAWAQAGHWDYIQQVLATGHGPHWSQPDKYPNGVNYALDSTGDVGAYADIPGGITVRQWLTRFLAEFAPRTGAAAQSAGYNTTGIPTQPAPGLPAPGAPPAPAPTQAGLGGGVGTYLLLGLGAFAVYKMASPRRRRARRHRR